jgi:membrane protease YdiL (CAAX protease family)
METPLLPQAAGTAALPLAVPISRPLALPWWFAAIQAFLICGIPTQVVVAGVLIYFFDAAPFDKTGGISLQFLASVLLFDTAVIALLIRAFLFLSGEESSDVFLGTRPAKREILRGLALVPVTFAAVTGIVVGLRWLFPSMHTVDQSPLEAYMRSPVESAVFLLVVVLAGGVREELQRAFILHRFEQRLGGIWLGLGLFSITFGVLHFDQGWDVATAIGMLGLFWGISYIRRRSAISNIVNHAGFNAAQVLQVVILRALHL